MIANMAASRRLNHQPSMATMDSAYTDHIDHDHRPAEKSGKIDYRAYGKVLLHHFKKHVGNGIICSVAYFDP